MVSEQKLTATHSHDELHNDEALDATNEQERTGTMERALADIAAVEERVADETGLDRHSPEVVAATDEALVYIAEANNANRETSGITAHDAAMDVIVEGALEARHLKVSSAENPAAMLDHDEDMHARITAVVKELHDAHVTLPDGSDAAEAAIRAIESDPIMSEGARGVEYVGASEQTEHRRDDDPAGDVRAISNGWLYENGTLVERDYRAIERSTQAARVVKHSEYIGNEGLTAAIDAATEALQAATLQSNMKLQKEIDQVSSLIQGRLEAGGDVPAPMQAARDALVARLGTVGDISRHPSVVAAVRQELADQERVSLEAKIEARVQADKLPWTMPGSCIPADMMNSIQMTYESMFGEQPVPADSDQIKVAPPMEVFDGAKNYTPEDEALLAAGGIDLRSRAGVAEVNHFTRAELKAANIFFINRLGGGEQPIFGVPIPDSDSENGVFNVQDRSFLTEEEFKKVYEYQQANGYGLEGKDPRDVQADMMMYAVRPESRNISRPRKRPGLSTREDKYNVARSPFVDNGFSLKYGVETYAPMPDGTSQRINTMTIHMAGNEKYPGTSEMFDPATVDHGQMYMSAGDFVRNFYISPPTRQEALLAMQSDAGMTKRERSWVGALPEAE